MTNPNFLSANSVTSSWSIYTTDSSKNYIDGISSGLKATPNLVGITVTVSTVQIDNAVVGAVNYFKI